MRFHWFAIFLAMVSLAHGEDNRPRVVVLGDSLAEGAGLDISEAFPAALQTLVDQAGLPFQVVNAGVSGNTTGQGLARLSEALAGGAAVLIVELGGNDGLRQLPLAVIESNLRAMVIRAREQIPDLQILIAGIRIPRSYPEDYRKAFADIFPRVTKDTKVEGIPDFLKNVGGVPIMNQLDRIHPTAQGQQILAENVWKVLEPVLKEIAKEQPRP